MSSCSGIPPLLPAQFMHSSSCALFLSGVGNTPPYFSSSVPSPLPLGSFLFCPTEPLSLLPPNTKRQRLSQVRNPPKILDLKAEAQLVPSYRTPPSGQGLVSHCLYSGLEKLGGKGMKLPHLMARKKLYFVHICTMRWLPLRIQRNWTQYTL